MVRSNFKYEKENKEECLLGQGAFGKVYKAHDIVTNKAVALKEINLAGMELQDYLMLEQEVDALRVLNESGNPAFPQLLDFQAEEEQATLSMELIEGRSLLHWVIGCKTLSPRAR